MTPIKMFAVYMAMDATMRVSPTLHSGFLAPGPRVAEFETRLQQVLATPITLVTTNSCTSAIDLACHLAGVGPGTSVLATPMTCTATNSPIVTRGAEIIWVDINPRTGLMDPADAARKAQHDTVACIAVDWAGRLCDFSTLGVLLPDTVETIEDAAHAFLAERPDKYHQAYYEADHTCWSFGAIKHLTTGDGGALHCKYLDDAHRARLLRWYGLDRDAGESFRCGDQQIDEVGYKYTMNDVAASIGLANLDHADWVVNEHRRHAATYNAALGDLPGVVVPPPDPGSAWWIYPLLVQDRARFMAFMAERGITTSPVHALNTIHPAFQRAARNPDDPLSNATFYGAHEVAIPVHWNLGAEDIERVIAAVRAYAHGQGDPR